MNWLVLLPDCLRCPTEDNERGCKHQSNLKKNKNMFDCFALVLTKLRLKYYVECASINVCNVPLG